MSRIFSLIFYFFIFFPYIRIVPFDTDIQPYALVVSMLYYIRYPHFVNPKDITLLVIPFIASVIMFVFTEVTFSAIRSISSYASLLFISYSSYYMLKYHDGFPTRFYEISIVIWFIIGLIQIAIDPSFATSLLSRDYSMNQGRGVEGLAPEPSFYGLMCIMFLLLNYVHDNKAWISIILILQIVIFAKSAIAILILIIMAFCYLVSNIGNRRVIFFLIGLITLLVAITCSDLSQYTDIRAVRLLDSMRDDPMVIFMTDRSANERYLHVYASINGFIENYGWPHFYESWLPYLQYVIRTNDVFFWNGGSPRIMSGYGAALYELGAIGLIIPFVITRALYRYYHGNSSKRIFLILSINIILFAAIQLALPIIGLLVGYLLYYASVENNTTETITA